MVAIEYGTQAPPCRSVRPATTTALCVAGSDMQGPTRSARPRSRPAGEVRSPHSYFWRRLLLLVLVAGSGALASSVTGRLMASASPSRASDVSCLQASAGGCLPATYVARPGDTIWAIAVRFSGNADPRPLEYRLEQQIGGRTLQPGDVLRVP